jgi:hypothetical protein
MGDVQHHFAVFREPTAYLFIKRHEKPVHLKTYGPGARLALAGASCTFTEVGQIFTADAFRGEMALDLTAAAVVYKYLEVHLGLAAQLVNVAEKLALV